MFRASRNQDANDPTYNRSFYIRHLNDATDANLEISHQSSFRPNFTVFPLLDETTKNAASVLVKLIRGNEKEFLDHITAPSLVALVSVNTDIVRKIAVVNLAIKWLLCHEIDTSTLHYLLQSITFSSFPFRKVERIRLAIYIYMTSTELINNYDIHLERYCNIYIRRKSGVPGDPTIFDEIDQLRFCQSVNQITDNYYNPSCPKRWDIECPKLQKALSCSLSRLINQHDLKNPFYSWGFKTKGSSFEPREPLKHIPQIEPCISPNDPEFLFKMDLIEIREVIEEEDKKSSGFGLLPKNYKSSLGSHQMPIKKVGSVVTTTSSGYGTNKSSSSSQPRFDIVTEFQENCSIVGPKVNNRQEAATALKTKHELLGPECYRQQQKPKWNWHNQNKQDKNRRMEHPTSSYLSCAKIPVTHRPAAASRVPFAQQQSVGNSKNQNSLHSSTHHPKKYFTNTSEPRKQVSSHKKPSEPKLVKPKPSIKYNEFIAKPKPKFSFDPVTNVLQKNF
ncbi:hypothetical protein L5515_000801 [Caenorhabditis briggsae]|uniref:Uncharacterized protein n=1 Tax=Caenorhabditis briggsae TaxID=6238 RepID=A0AAE9E399_CAEBR|nr:hypothetical protein L5515_000801 [Caenorhabditis briggsae]